MGSAPNDPMYSYGRGYPPQGPPSGRGRGMALAGLILGIVGLVLCWVPLLNVLALIAALVGLGLSIAALVPAVRDRTGAKGLAIAGVIVSGLAVIGSILAITLLSFFFSAVTNTMNDGNYGSPYGGQSGGTPTPPSASAVPGSDLLPLGTAAEVGDYTVTVSSVQPDATDSILGFSQVNQAPSGQYVLLTLDVTYNGSGEGNPWLDLTAGYVGSDNRQYDESSCDAVLELDGTAVPTLEQGGQAQYQACMDVPPDAIPGKRILVEKALEINGPDEASWQVQ